MKSKSKIAILLVISIYGADANAQFFDKLKEIAEKVEEQVENAAKMIEEELQDGSATNSEALSGETKQGDSYDNFRQQNCGHRNSYSQERCERRFALHNFFNDPNRNNIKTPDYRLSAEDITSVPRSNWVLVWQKVPPGFSRFPMTEDVKIYIDTTERNYPYDIGVYKFVENRDVRVEILSHSCKDDITSSNYISPTLSSIQAFKLNDQEFYEETETTDKKYSYKQPTGQVHFYFCEQIRDWRLKESYAEMGRNSNPSLKKRANQMVIYESAYFQEGIKYDANLMPFRNTAVKKRIANYCSPFFAYTGMDQVALAWTIGEHQSKPVTADQINVDFISNAAGKTDVRLTRECLDMNFNTFMSVIVKNENKFNGSGSAVPSWVEGNYHNKVPRFLSNTAPPPSKFFNNPQRLSTEEIKEIYITNRESSDPLKFNEIAVCPAYFEIKGEKYSDQSALYHIYTGELVIPEHLSGDQFMTRGFAEEDVSNDCMESMWKYFQYRHARGINTRRNNPKGLSDDQMETLFEKQHYKVSL